MVCDAGAYFSRKKQVLGLTTGSEKVHLRLSSDEQRLVARCAYGGCWRLRWRANAVLLHAACSGRRTTRSRTRPGSASAACSSSARKVGHMPCTAHGALADAVWCSEGNLGMAVVGRKGDVLLEVEAETPSVRDEWVTSLQLLFEGSGAEETEVEAESRLTFRKVIEERKQKQAYWTQRTQELEDRKRDAEDRKKQFAGTGMKYTALAMANRSTAASASATD